MQGWSPRVRLCSNFFEMENSRILELAAVINKSVKAIHESLVEQTLPSPSFEPTTSRSLPESLLEDQDAVLDATAELHDLFLGPLNLLFHHGGVSDSHRMRKITAYLFNTTSITICSVYKLSRDSILQRNSLWESKSHIHSSPSQRDSTSSYFGAFSVML